MKAKKIHKKHGLSLLLAAICALMMTACNAGERPQGPADTSGTQAETSAPASEKTEPESTEPEETDPEEEPGGTSGKYATIADYVASERMQEQIASLKESFGSLGLQIEMIGQDNKLIYKYTYATQMPTDGLAETLKQSLEPQAGVFEAEAASLKLVVEVEDPVVVIMYCNADGSEILTQEYTAAE